MEKLHKILILLFLIGSAGVVIIYALLTVLAVMYGGD